MGFFVVPAYLFYNVDMSKYPRKSKLLISSVIWSTEQDCYLIENSHLTVDVLALQLNFTVDDIQERKEILGLNRRNRQLNRLKWR